MSIHDLRLFIAGNIRAMSTLVRNVPIVNSLEVSPLVCFRLIALGLP